MGKRTRRYETEFVTCLLVNGPLPDGLESFPGSARVEYRAAVMDWWRNWHGALDTPPTEKSCWRFWKRYRTWLKVNSRRLDYGD